MSKGSGSVLKRQFQLASWNLWCSRDCHYLFLSSPLSVLHPLNAITGKAVWFPESIAAGRGSLIGSSPSTEKVQVTAPGVSSQLQLDCEPSS